MCVSINGRQLSRVPSRKYLGVYIDEHLTWQKHTQYVYQRVQSRLHCLYRLCPLSDTLLCRLYCAFILPILDCRDIVWSPSSVQFFKRLECVHYFRLHKVFSLYFSRTQTIPHCHYGLQNSSSPLANFFTRYLNTLQLLPLMLAETVIAFLCQEFGPLMARTVFFI